MARKPSSYINNASAHHKNLKTGEVFSLDYGWSSKGSEIPTGSGNPMREDGTYPPSNYHLVKVDQKNARGVIRATSPTSDNMYYGYLGGIYCSPHFHEFVFSERVRDKARLRAMRKLSSDFSLPVTLAEMKKTNEMIADSGIRIADALSSLKSDPSGKDAADILKVKRPESRSFSSGVRAAVRATGRKADFLASKWLELRYGWVPVLYDAWAAADALSGIDNVKWEKVRGRYEQSLRDDYVVEDGSWFLGGKQRVKTGGSETSQVTGLYRPDLSAIWTLVAKRLGLTNPLTVTWELTKLSFVVDWFSPIGDWLSQLDAPLGLEFRDFTETQVIKGSNVTTRKEKGFYGSTSIDINWLSRQNFVEMKRAVLDGPPVARLPRINNIGEIVSAPRLADSMALLNRTFQSVLGVR